MSANNSTGASILGIEPDKEQNISYIKIFFVEGKFYPKIMKLLSEKNLLTNSETEVE